VRTPIVEAAGGRLVVLPLVRLPPVASMSRKRGGLTACCQGPRARPPRGEGARGWTGASGHMLGLLGRRGPQEHVSALREI